MFKAPTQLPPVSLLLDDLPTQDARRVARHLGLSEATIRKYRRDDDAPRLVLLALFFETRWGRSIMDTELEHRHQLHLQLISSQRRRITELEATVGRLLDVGDFGAANAPIFDCERTPQAGPRSGQPVLVTVAAARAAVDPVAQLRQLGQHQGGDQGPAQDDQRLTK